MNGSLANSASGRINGSKHFLRNEKWKVTDQVLFFFFFFLRGLIHHVAPCESSDLFSSATWRCLPHIHTSAVIYIHSNIVACYACAQTRSRHTHPRAALLHSRLYPPVHCATPERFPAEEICICPPDSCLAAHIFTLPAVILWHCISLTSMLYLSLFYRVTHSLMK